MKKYNLNANLTVKDKQLQDNREELIIQFIDRMQKFTAEAERVARDASRPLEERYEGVKFKTTQLAALADFLQNDMGVEIRESDGMLVTQKLFNRAYYFETSLRVEIARKNEAEGLE